MKWISFWWEEQPTISGWYPILICYDPHEGFFPHGAYWNGSEWDRNAVSHWLPTQAKDQESANDEAYKHDPNW